MGEFDNDDDQVYRPLYWFRVAAVFVSMAAAIVGGTWLLLWLTEPNTVARVFGGAGLLIGIPPAALFAIMWLERFGSGGGASPDE